MQCLHSALRLAAELERFHNRTLMSVKASVSAQKNLPCGLWHPHMETSKNGSYTLRSVILLPRLSTTGGFSHNKISPIWVLSDFTALSPTVTCNKCVLVQRWNPCRSVQHVQEYMMLLCILNHEVDHFLDNFIIHCIFACIYVRPSTKGDGNSYSQDAHCCTTSTYFRQIFFIVPGWKLLIF